MKEHSRKYVLCKQTGLKKKEEAEPNMSSVFFQIHQLDKLLLPKEERVSERVENSQESDTNRSLSTRKHGIVRPRVWTRLQLGCS